MKTMSGNPILERRTIEPPIAILLRSLLRFSQSPLEGDGASEAKGTGNGSGKAAVRSAKRVLRPLAASCFVATGRSLARAWPKKAGTIDGGVSDYLRSDGGNMMVKDKGENRELKFQPRRKKLTLDGCWET